MLTIAGAGNSIQIFKYGWANEALITTDYIFGTDLKTFTANGRYGASAITALVADNTVLGVHDVFPSPLLFIVRQASAFKYGNSL